MADSVFSVQDLKDFLNSQIYDEEKSAFNMKLLRAVGLFTGSIFLCGIMVILWQSETGRTEESVCNELQ